ncbi:MAG: AGE family epimerase/isomerase [Varibaculum sp.]|nr:AGE family epimerase/isomerase [Varibaculum sp.]
MGWLQSIEHQRWLSEKMRECIDYAKKTKVDTGFATLGLNGEINPEEPTILYVTARNTHIFALGTLLGIPGCRNLATHGIKCLTEYFQDRENGGWYDVIEQHLDADGNAVPIPGIDHKLGYSHAFVLLAAASCTAANRVGANELLQDAMDIQNEYWWDDENHIVRESYTRDWGEPREKHDVNTQMHTTEAYLTCADVTGDSLWLDRSLAVLEHVAEIARTDHWRIPVHYSTSWQRLNESEENESWKLHQEPGHIVGHGFEFTRLMLQARAMLQAQGRDVPEWLQEAPSEIFERARVDSWRRDGLPGFVFTIDDDGEPVSRERHSWVCWEAINAAVALYRATEQEGDTHAGDLEHYEHCYHVWLDYADEFLMLPGGNQVIRLDQNNQRIQQENLAHRETLYHTVQSLLIPRLPLTPAIAPAIAEGHLDDPTWNPTNRSENTHWWSRKK